MSAGVAQWQSRRFISVGSQVRSLPPAPMTETQQQQIVELAKSLVGKSYAYGAAPDTAPNTFDCSSFTQYLFKQVSIDLPRSALLQAGDSKGTEIKVTNDFSNLKPGDLLFMRSDRGHYHDELFGGRKIDIGHVVMYLGAGEIIHARKKLNGVVIQKLSNLISEPNYEIVFAKRF